MIDDIHPGATRIYNELTTSAVHCWTGIGTDHFLERLAPADYVSLVALFFAWLGALFMLNGAPNWGLLVVVVAIAFDKLDGYVARRLEVSSTFGRQIDSFLDIFAYLIPAALLYHITMAPNLITSAVIGFMVIGFGGLRLVRHNSEGFQTENGTSYYHGTTVVHTFLVVVLSYLASQAVTLWNGWGIGLLIASICPLMVSNYRSPKTNKTHGIATGVIGFATIGILLLAMG